MRHTLTFSACFLLLAASQSAHANGPSGGCCSTYPIYVCPPGYLSYPAPPGILGHLPVTGCHGCGNCTPIIDSSECMVVTPNPYSCCFYGVTISNYALMTPYGGAYPAAVPSQPSMLPPSYLPGEKLPTPHK